MASNSTSSVEEALLEGSDDAEKQIAVFEKNQILRRARSCLTHFYRRAGTVLVALLPSYLGRKLRKEAPKPFIPGPTSYLDGMRGIFSFLVFVRHYLLPWEETLDNGYAQIRGEGEIGNRSVLKLPIARLLYSGPTVAIFFIVSGYVVSYKPLKLIRKGHHEALSRAMISSVFRRGLRLFLPPVITTFFVAVAAYLRLFNSPYDSMPGAVPRHPEVFDSLFLQLKDWARFLALDLTRLWTWTVPRSEYDSHLWTIPIQFRSSMILFLIIIGLSKARTRIRGAVLIFFYLYCLMQHRWDLALFLAGMFLAEQNLIQREEEIQNASHGLLYTPPKRSVSFLLKIFWRCVFLIGLYLGSFPRKKDAAQETPGYVWISRLTPNFHYWQGYAATLILWSTSNDRLLQSLFTSPFMSYFGSISFSLYLVHGPLLHLLGYSLVPALWGLTGQATDIQNQCGILLGLLILTPIVLWVADVFWRFVDTPCAQITVQVERYCVS